MSNSNTVIVNTFNILSKRYPLRLKTARKGIRQLDLLQDNIAQSDESIFFNKIELINISYLNLWIALEGFIEIFHLIFGLNSLDSKKKPKELATKISEIKAIINDVKPQDIFCLKKSQISPFLKDREDLNKLFKKISLEVNNNNKFESKKKRNFMSHLPFKEATHYKEVHQSLVESESAKERFYSSSIIDTHNVYGLTKEIVERLYNLFDLFMSKFVSFINTYINEYNLCLFIKNQNNIDDKHFSLSLLNIMIRSAYDAELTLCSGTQHIEKVV